ncbi:hypothetical protein KAK07_09415 [Ideonella sp. 4Y16]|uniref:Uncharacterized protein n=1 Tax=Ideonella alba TaxID=2824118 RepID=A0A940YHD3_9BURK|nr:hypothetical protein [Ideonella alba]MBQ0933401.1 hypothetical protein [Ideonella alba]MBQ0943554.1 hypothetical protein [Ideonella alba]
MTPAQLALGVAGVVGVFNAAFFSVVAYEISGHSVAAGAAGALIILVAEALLVKNLGPKIGAQLNESLAPANGS